MRKNGFKMQGRGQKFMLGKYKSFGEGINL